MKKIIIMVTLFLSFFLWETTIKAYGIDQYEMDITILENGDLHVKELYYLNGDFNGSNRFLLTKNNHSKEIYQYHDIQMEMITTLPHNIMSSITDPKNVLPFTKVGEANNGDTGVYVETKTPNGYQYKIYNPSKLGNRGFYLSYTIKGAVIQHQDIAELQMNLFTEEHEESIRQLKITYHLPTNQDDLRIWAHGPLNGEIKLLGNQTATVLVTDLFVGSVMDVRLVFDKEAVSPVKKTDESVLDRILIEETQKAEEANQLREEAREREKREELFRYITGYISLSWIVGLGILTVHMYKRYDKEYPKPFLTKYYRNFPNEYGPEIVSYLFHQKVGANEVSASIMNLIVKKVITFSEPNKNEYIFYYDIKKQPSNVILTHAEKNLIRWLFEKIGKNGTVALSTIKATAKKDYELFVSDYKEWESLAIKEAETKQFYENHSAVQTKAVWYNILGFVLAIVGIMMSLHPFLFILMIVLTIATLIYFLGITKRTKYGNEEYYKWLGLKNFLKDFGTFKEKELPHVTLWEKYLVYAITFGIAEKLIKTMKVKINQLEKNPMTSDGTVLPDLFYVSQMMRAGTVMASTVQTTVTKAISDQALASSANSSGSGFGGGFSGGGGFGGGGGGVGRF